MTAKVLYEGALRCKVIHKKSGTLISTDAPLDNEGKGESFSPTDLIAAALGTCMLTIMGIAARNHDIYINGTTAEITKTMASDPRRISKLEVVIQMANSHDTKERKILEAAAHGCPVGLSLHQDLEETLAFVYPD